MKLSRLMHLTSILLGLVGALALIGAWTVGEEGAVLGLSQAHLFSDAIIFELMAIAASVCTLVRLKLEAASPGRSPWSRKRTADARLAPAARRLSRQLAGGQGMAWRPRRRRGQDNEEVR